MASESISLPRPPLRYGMVGGGQGAFIGDVHRKAIALDSSAELVAGSFSQDFQNTQATGRELRLAEDRLYRSFEEMASAEAARKDGIDFVVIVTPNFLHYRVCKAFLEAGIHVVCDKPLTFETAEAEELQALAHEKELLFMVTYTYTGYPMVKHAKALVADGRLGKIRFVNAEYPQEWLAGDLEKSGNKQASWRTDPTKSGKANCLGDIGTHIENLVAYITGLEIQAVSARLDRFVDGRQLDDNATVMLEYDQGAKGVYWSSQIAVGCDNGLRVRVFGERGALEFRQEDPNYLWFTPLGEPAQKLSRGRDELSPRAGELVRIPSGHPEGYFEAFANLYRSFAGALEKKLAGEALDASESDFPGVEAGLAGVKFVDRCVASSEAGGAWTPF